MRPHFYYFSFVIASLLLFPGFGTALSAKKPVKLNIAPQYNYGKMAQALPEKNSQSEVKRLNAEAIKLLGANRSEQALQTLQKALLLTTDTGQRWWEAVTLNNIGRVYQKQGQYSQALKSYEQALLINRELGDRVQLGKTYSNIGYLFDIQNRPDLAVFFYKHCLINREISRLVPAALEVDPDAYSITVAQTYRTLAERLLRAQRQISQAQRAMDLLKVEELQQYLLNVPGNQRTAKGIEISPEETPTKEKLDQTLDNAVVLGKELTKLRQISPERRSPQQKQRIAQLVTNQQQLLDRFNDFINSPQVRSQVEQINRTARRQNLDLESLNEIRDNLARLPQKAVLVYPLVLPDSLELVLVTADSPPIHRSVAVKRENLNQTISAFRQALQTPSQNAKKPGRQLYDWLIKPIENDLKQAGTQTIIYAPDEQLRYVPLAALYDGTQWLVQRYSINHITAASLTNFNTQPESKLRVLAAAFTKGNYEVRVGNRKFAFSGLPFAAQEVQSLATIIPGTKKILDDAFSLAATVPQLDDYTVVHFATHAAFVTGRPENSFILFGNGDRINLRDVANWSLPRVELVVLSACETGLGGKLGSGEEILGFGYQMQKTGARAAIASLWAVDDGGTETLMTAFYTLLNSSKLPKSEALRQAQIALITGKSPTSKQQNGSNNISLAVDGSLNHPYYWAPFILIGNGL
ncbi:CHAT domain-containing protein [Hassallia byssoidea VB512170]|uniref:CHAT domain-containing protein n=1 Tax=Hassallia byssoidea VB512170 TaxID=1304833 RepID=A0A846HE26_9CYAN|nr:CHAT domain-containing protein [Hassalia byssoidea]NEU74850.1 CHAT domain-containing protein [Hassalia byssoidea VB512170]